MTASSLKIGGIGGSIGGLTAAVALRQAGFDVDLYEQAPELTEIGGGINMGPNAVRVLRRLGLGAGLDREGVQPDRHAPAPLAGRPHLAEGATQPGPAKSFTARRTSRSTAPTC